MPIIFVKYQDNWRLRTTSYKTMFYFKNIYEKSNKWALDRIYGHVCVNGGLGKILILTKSY